MTGGETLLLAVIGAMTIISWHSINKYVEYEKAALDSAKDQNVINRLSGVVNRLTDIVESKSLDAPIQTLWEHEVEQGLKRPAQDTPTPKIETARKLVKEFSATLSKQKANITA